MFAICKASMSRILLWKIIFIILSTLITVGCFDHSDFHVIISRFNEDITHLRWLRHIPHTILNRGGHISIDWNLHSANITHNVGREGFLYLEYILNHYHRLPKLLIASQAVQAYKCYTNTNFEDDVMALYSGRIQIPIQNEGFAFFLPIRWPISAGFYDVNSHPLHQYFPGYSYNVSELTFSPTGCFVVTREAILRNTYDRYLELARYLGNENNPNIGFFIERVWPEIFQSTCAIGNNESCFLYDRPHCTN